MNRLLIRCKLIPLTTLFALFPVRGRLRADHLAEGIWDFHHGGFA